MRVLSLLKEHIGKLLLLVLLLLFLEVFGYVDELEETLGFNSGRMEFVRGVGHLAPFPTDRSHLAVRHQVGMFGNMTTIYFVSSADVISQWLQDSEGVREAKKSAGPFDSTCYYLGPGRGFLYVSKDGTEVGINLGQALDGPTHNSPIPFHNR